MKKIKSIKMTNLKGIHININKIKNKEEGKIEIKNIKINFH